MLCVKAYNDWMVDEWCGGSGGRLIPLCLIPLWDPEAAAAEIRRNAARGVRAVTFSEIPPNLGLPSIHDRDDYWHPFFEACNETGTVICMHIGSGSKMVTTSPDAPIAVASTLAFANASYALTDWLMSGLFTKFPDLTLALSEGQIGWIPYIIERADVVWEENRGWNEIQRALPAPLLRLLLPRPPRREVARRHRGRHRHLRDRLPPPRLDLARLPGRGRGRDQGPRRRDHREGHPGQRHPHAPVGPVSPGR